jgi:hypothetical protein
MKNRIAILVICTAALAAAALAQTAQLPAPSPVEKELAARASNVDEITLGKDKLGLASSFMNGSGDASTSKMIAGLDGIYVRDYEFDKEGEYTADQIEQLRKYFESNEWTTVVRDQNRKTGELSEIMVKQVDGKPAGLFILDVEPKEISIVLILGPVGMDAMGKLGEIISFAATSGTKAAPHGNGKHDGKE